MTTLLIGTDDGLFELDPAGGAAGQAVEVLGGAVTPNGGLDASGWAIVDGERVVRSSGGTWEEVAADDAASLTCIVPYGDGAVVGTRGAHLRVWRGNGLEPLPAFDEVAARETWNTPWGASPDVRSLAVTGSGALLANVHVGGIPRSTDGGMSWQPTIDVEADVHQVVAHPTRPDTALAAAAVGLARSDDGGATWKIVADGLHATYSRAVAVAGDSVLVTASTGPFTKEGAVYRRPLDGDAPFERVSDWLPHNIDSGCITADGELAAFGGPDGVVHVSDDAGRSWRVLVDGLPPVRGVALR